MEGKKLKELYEYLDGYSFVNYDEVEVCVNDFFVENYEILEPSYGDLFFYHELAIRYISDRGLEFEEDIVNGEDVNHVEDWKKEVLSYNQSKGKIEFDKQVGKTKYDRRDRQFDGKYGIQDVYGCIMNDCY